MFDIPGMPTGPQRLPAIRTAAAPARVCAPASPRVRDGQNPRTPARPLSDAEQWWQYSRKCAAALQAGLPPTPVSVFGPVLRAGELALLNVEVGYSRYSGSKASYSSLPLIVAGKPAVMFGALAVQGVVNHRRKEAAQRQAAPQWRWHQTTAAIVTTERLLCATKAHGLVSLWFGDCTEFHPDLQQWTLTLGFGSTVPVRFSGVATPALSLLSAYGTFGDAWADDPRLAALLP
ncbi:hypothetical protein [Mycobacterium paragordonae]|uniref:hypothetical protein n=1 Tax=Mycobacterium paragordonae TaxID=1389713 RepID=UPI001060CD73|nr:hypothetical protein [Mycobacterium paragordonae]TDL03255.1 hypothetical protein EUA05_24950 [Mycobacterium paragordonae]